MSRAESRHGYDRDWRMWRDGARFVSGIRHYYIPDTLGTLSGKPEKMGTLEYKTWIAPCAAWTTDGISYALVSEPEN